MLSDDELARIRNKEIGFVFQTFNLLPRADALPQRRAVRSFTPAWDPRSGARRAAGSLTQVGLADRMDHRPNELSGGQRQRGRHRARAGECAEHPARRRADRQLDSATGNEIMGLFHELHDTGQTIVLVTHEHDIAAHARRQIHLLDGKIARDERTEGQT